MTLLKSVFVIIVCACIAACGAPAEPVSPDKQQQKQSQIRGADLGAPQAQASDAVDDSRAIERDVIVKNANTDDEVLVSRPTRRPPLDPANTSDEKQAFDGVNPNDNPLHKGQMVSDFAEVEGLQVDGYQIVLFHDLSNYIYIDPNMDLEHPGADMTLMTQLHRKSDGKKGDDQIPKKLRDLNGKKVAVPGFMLPSDNLKQGQTDNFLLVQVLPSCFFCKIPNVTEWVTCASAKRRFPYHKDKPVLVMGTLSVGAFYTDSDYLESIYRLDVDDVKVLDEK